MLSSLDLLGWVGGALGASAYVLVSTRRIVPDGLRFQGLNMLGAALLSVASFNSGALPSACLNLAWILVGIHSLVVLRHRRRRSAPSRVLDRTPAPLEAEPDLRADLVDAA